MSASPLQDRPAGLLANVAGAVLVGGASERMGRDKAQIVVDGVSLASRTAHLLSRICADVLIVGGEVPEDSPGRAVADPDTGSSSRCALRGLVAALSAARSDRVLVLATDMPHLTLEVLLGLVAWPESDAVVARDDAGRRHPLCAIYRREPVLEVARERLESGRLALNGVLDAVGTDELAGADLAALDPSGRALANLNTPEDLAAALADATA